MISCIKQLLFACGAGLFLMIFVIQRDETVKSLIAHEFKKTFEQFFDASMECTVDSVNVFNGTLALKDVAVVPKSHTTWKWSAKKFSLHCSLWNLLWNRRIDADLFLDNYHAHSEIDDNNLAILEHINDLINGPPLIFPLNIRFIAMKNSRIQVHDSDLNFSAMFAFDSESKRIGSLLKSTVYCVHGELCRGNKKIIDSIKATLHAEFDDQLKGLIKATSSCMLSKEITQYPHITVAGIWQNDHGEISIKNEDASLIVDPIKIVKNEHGISAELKGKINNQFYKKLLPREIKISDSDVLFSAKATYKSQELSISGDADARLSIAHIPIAAHSDFAVHNNSLLGNYTSTVGDQVVVNGDWDFNIEKKEVKLSGALTPKNSFYAWQLLPASNFTFKASSQGNIQAEYEGGLRNETTKKMIHVKGSLDGNQETFSCSGRVNQSPYLLSGRLQPTIGIHEIKYGNHDALKLHQINNGTLEGNINLSCIKTAAKFFFDYDLQAEGNLEIACKKDKDFHLTTKLKQGTIRIPYTHNIIHDMQATIDMDLDHWQIVFHDVATTLHRGKVWSDRAIISLNQNYALENFYVPLFFESCVLNYSKDLLAVVSGNVLLSQTGEGKPLLHAHLFFEHAHIKENIFADSFLRSIIKNAQQSLQFESPGQDLACDCLIQTTNPLQIRTSFLQADAKLNLKITQSLQSPKIDGAITLVSGDLKFPYRPLFITQGKIQFDSDHPLNPMIECIAKNRIKNYNVALQVTGTVTDPHILIESSPPLLEEQVLSLLLVGSKEDSLNVMVPAFVMHSINPLLFGLAPSTKGLSNYFASILKPFKRIHLIPTFTDQTGRGGLRGAFEVDVNDRLHALIQKNFSLTEDTLFELEYLLSDEIGVKLFRDERRDMGAEVEMRWKF